MTAMIRQLCEIKPQNTATVRSTELLAWLGIEDLDLILKERSSAGMDKLKAPTVQSRQPLTYRLIEAQDDLEAADREGSQSVEALSYGPSW